MTRQKRRSKTKADRGVPAPQFVPPDFLDPGSLSGAVSAIFESLYADACRSLVSKGLLAVPGSEEDIESEAVLRDAAAAAPALAALAPGTAADPLSRWEHFEIPCNDGTCARLDSTAWGALPAPERARLAELLDGLVMAARLVVDGGGSEGQVLRTLLPCPPTGQTGSAVPGPDRPAGSPLAEDDVYVAELNRILPPSLKNSDLFMGIVGEISSQIRSTGLISRIEEEIAAEVGRQGTAEDPDPSRLADLEDEDLPALESLPADLRKRIEEAAAAEGPKGGAELPGKINPMFMLKLSQSLMGSGEAAGPTGDISGTLRSIADGISKNLKTQVEQNKVSPDVIKTDLQNALSYLGQLGFGGGLPPMAPQPLD